MCGEGRGRTSSLALPIINACNAMEARLRCGRQSPAPNHSRPAAVARECFPKTTLVVSAPQPQAQPCFVPCMCQDRREDGTGSAPALGHEDDAPTLRTHTRSQDFAHEKQIRQQSA